MGWDPVSRAASGYGETGARNIAVEMEQVSVACTASTILEQSKIRQSLHAHGEADARSEIA